MAGNIGILHFKEHMTHTYDEAMAKLGNVNIGDNQVQNDKDQHNLYLRGQQNNSINK